MNTTNLPKSAAVTDMLTKVMSTQPFFGSYFYTNMGLVETRDVPRAATDGKVLFFNPDFMEKLTLDERVFVFCHEILHGVFLHNARGKYWGTISAGPDGKKWSHNAFNVGVDWIVNSILKDSKIGRAPDGALFRAGVDGQWTLEEAYKVARQDEPDDGNGGGGNGGGDNGGGNSSTESHGSFDEHLPSPDDTIDEVEASSAIAGALQTAKMAGNLPGALERALTTVLEPKVEWEEMLQAAMERTAGSDATTWARPHRRRMAMYDTYLPSKTGFQTGGVAVIIDVSGSISDTEVSQFLAEVSSIMSQTTPEWIKVLWVDTKVSAVDEPDTAEDVPFLKAKGGGGTDMGAGLRYIRDEFEVQPTTIICLTDGYTPWGEEPEESQMIWGITRQNQMDAPFGEMIYVEITEEK